MRFKEPCERLHSTTPIDIDSASMMINTLEPIDRLAFHDALDIGAYPRSVAGESCREVDGMH